MGIYIKGLTKENWDNLTIEEIEENFEIVEVKTPHGMLIDENDVLRFFNTHDESLSVIEAEDE